MEDAAPHVFITSDLGCEVGLTSLVRFLLPEKDVRMANISMADIKKPEVLCSTIEKLSDRPASLTLCGDFWGEDSLAQVFEKFPGLAVINYKFGGEVVAHNWAAPLDPASPVDFIIKRVDQISPRTPARDFLLNHYARVGELLDARCRGVDVAATQPFFAGLGNITDEDVNLEERIFNLLSGVYTLDDVLKIGNTIVKNQIAVARERALRNAREGTLKDGTPYVITNGPEFINLTHEELHCLHSGAKVTIVAALKFGADQSDQVAHSFRSWSADVDVRAIVGERGGGSPTAAGGRCDIDVHLDF